MPTSEFEHAHVSQDGILPYQRRYGVVFGSKPRDVTVFRAQTALAMASSQNLFSIDEPSNIDRDSLKMVLFVLSATPFCCGI